VGADIVVLTQRHVTCGCAVIWILTHAYDQRDNSKNHCYVKENISDFRILFLYRTKIF
jgi:hypothetical protein